MRPSRILAASLAGFFTLFALGTEGKDLGIRHQGVTANAMKVTGTSPLVHAQLGDDVRISWPISGEYRFSDLKGYAEIDIPLTGSRGKGHLHVDAIKTAGQWHLISALFSTRSESAQSILPPHNSGDSEWDEDESKWSGRLDSN